MVTKRKKKRQKRLLDTFCRVRERGHCSQASEAEQPFEDCSGNQKNILGIFTRIQKGRPILKWETELEGDCSDNQYLGGKCTRTFKV